MAKDRYAFQRAAAIGLKMVKRSSEN
jgi:hypothetical protein